MAGGSAVSGPRPRSWTLDGWYDDEFAPAGKINPKTGCPFNIHNGAPDFNSVGNGTAVLSAANPLEDATLTRVLENGKGNGDFGRTDWDYWCYAPPAVRTTLPPILKVSLIFGSPGPVMCRHGLRHYLETLTDRVLIMT